jgi:hypothetical protein
MFTQTGIFGLKIYHLATLASSTAHKCCHVIERKEMFYNLEPIQRSWVTTPALWKFTTEPIT